MKIMVQIGRNKIKVKNKSKIMVRFIITLGKENIRVISKILFKQNLKIKIFTML